METRNGWRLLLAALVCSFVGIMLWSLGLRLARVMVAAFPPRPALAQPAAMVDIPSWHTYRVGPLLNESFELDRAKSWTDNDPSVVSNTRTCTVYGRFTATAPVWFIALDVKNTEILQAGNPPLSKYWKLSSGNPLVPEQIVLDCVGQGGTYNFVVPPRPVQPFPLTKLDLVLMITRAVGQAPAVAPRVNVELGEERACLCSEREARDLASR